uniref:Small ribosomal subunit protein uS5m n=1 Tax=Phallusia mammillata TaxID=59560 RepID=A0A6F9DLE8_9ASCI|nr:28S ribosomal protein S5, mitochondrial-like [Phallusia mammillata]
MQSVTKKFNLFKVAFASAIQLTRQRHDFINQVTATALWNSVSPTKKRTGRGKRGQARKKVDLGRHKVLGENELGIEWPGLNAKTENKLYKRTRTEQQAYVEDREKFKQGFRREKTVVRGWTGAQWGGLRIPAPESTEDNSFEDFQCVLLQAARVAHRDKTVGRIYRLRCMVAVGNGKGVMGIAGSTSANISAAVRKARNKAFRRLHVIERYEDRTVYEDMFVAHHRTWMQIRKQPKGYGLHCHRAVTDICKLIGFKDMYVKTFGSTTMLNLMKCFLKGILKQETYQQKADRLGYHVVELDPRRCNYPVVLASPKKENEKTVPNDEYTEYMNQELLVRDVKKQNKSSWSHFYKAIHSNNRGIPVPKCPWLPEELTQLKYLSLDSS